MTSFISNVFQVAEFFSSHFTANRLQITSMGLSLEQLNQFVAQVDVESGIGPQPVNAVYYGGEDRILNNKEHNAYIAVAGPTPGWVARIVQS